MNKYLEKIAAKGFQTPTQVEARLQPKSFRGLEWTGKKIIDPMQRMRDHASDAAKVRSGRLDKAKSLLTKKRLTVGIKTGLGVAAGVGAYHLGKSILNNMEP